MNDNPQHLSYYERLGILEDASVEEIERAYRDLRKQFHPDTKPPAYRDYFDHSMKGINEAYDVLKDPSKRHRYDLKLSKDRISTQESHQEPRQKHKGGWTQKRPTAEEKRSQYKGKTRKLPLNHENYEYALREFQRRMDTLEDLMRKLRAYLAEMNGIHENLSAELATALESAEAKEEPRIRLRIIEHYKETKKFIEQQEEAARASSLSSLQGLEKRNDYQLGQLLYAENHLSNLPTERRRELQATYNKLMRQLYKLWNHQPSS